MPGIRQLLGASGERAAARYLRRCGYAIVVRNYRCPAGEIDLIALEGRCIVFVEVKTRRDRSHGDPIEAVGFHKQRQIARAALYFLQQHRLRDRAVRFDVVGVVPEGRFGRLRCTLIRDAFEAPVDD